MPLYALDPIYGLMTHRKAPDAVWAILGQSSAVWWSMLPVGSDKVLVLSVQSQWQDYITLAVAELANLQPIVGNED